MIGALDLLLRKAGAVRFSVNEHRCYYESPERDLRTHMLLPQEWSNAIDKKMVETMGLEKDSRLTVAKIFVREEVEDKERAFTVGVSPALVVYKALDRWRVENACLDPVTDFSAEEAVELEDAILYLTVEAVSWFIDGNEHLRQGFRSMKEQRETDPDGMPTWVGEPVPDDYAGDAICLTFYPNTPVGSYRMAAASVADVLRAAHALLKEERGQ